METEGRLGTSGTQGQRIARLVEQQETTPRVVETLMEQWQTESGHLQEEAIQLSLREEHDWVAIEALSTKLNEEIWLLYD
ncbi:unnamed protein product [Spirodela intermedia]|uniref:Uncharacterized protein n=2 Tax=Spirodela intermedia TaxID=51605 RepID=A0A7I8IU86_SPIIN|nr:unnamed protein product [Spirodela intermedia]CAA6661110.1 unnamed protein product [Spirodela intermedia]CAA7397478.1 unnamed protein product [Spirodela intermedia]